jgi:hypothetical protein
MMMILVLKTGRIALLKVAYFKILELSIFEN